MAFHSVLALLFNQSSNPVHSISLVVFFYFFIFFIPGTLRSTSGVTGHSLWAPRSPRFCGSRPKGEAGRRSREPPTCSGACAQQAKLGPGKGKPGGLNAQAQGGGRAIRSGDLRACAESGSKGRDEPKGKTPWAHAHT